MSQAKDDMLTLSVDDLDELREWAGVEGWDRVRTLELTLLDRRSAPDHRLASFLELPELETLEELAIDAPHPLPREVMAAIARMPSLGELKLYGLVRDAQLIELCAAPARTELRVLWLHDAQLSLDAYEALAGATFRACLRELRLMWVSCDASALALLLESSWPALERLELPRLDDSVTQRVQEWAEASGVQLHWWDISNRALVPRHAQLVADSRALLEGTPRATAFQALMKVAALFDSERFEAKLRAEFEQALARWPDATRMWSGEPPAICEPLLRALVVSLGSSEMRQWLEVGDALPITSLEISATNWASLRGLDLASRCEQLRSLSLVNYPLSWEVLATLALPPTLEELDICGCYDPFPRDGYIPDFVRWLPSRLRRVRVPMADQVQIYCSWRLDADGWFYP